MKAALEAWGAASKLFHHGVARETNDSDIVTATMSKPGVVLKRPVGSKGPFSEHPGSPNSVAAASARKSPQSTGSKPTRSAGRPVDSAAERKAAAAYERDEKRRERDRAKAEAAAQR